MPRQILNIPTNKVVAGSIGAAVATLAIFAIERTTGDVLRPEIQMAITTVVTFALGYFVPPSQRDGIE